MEAARQAKVAAGHGGCGTASLLMRSDQARNDIRGWRFPKAQRIDMDVDPAAAIEEKGD